MPYLSPTAAALVFRLNARLTKYSNFIGQPPNYYQDIVQTGYFDEKYHTPYDTFNSTLQYDGMIQQARVAFRVAYPTLKGRQKDFILYVVGHYVDKEGIPVPIQISAKQN